MKLLSWVMKNSVVEFRGKKYLQIRGTAMGTPAAVVFAVLFMSHVDELVEAKNVYIPDLHCRFIDDGFLVWTAGRQALDAFLSSYNNSYPSIAITNEVSTEKVDFMDLTVYKGERFKATGVLDIKVYQKPMNKYLYLPFKSYHTRKTKTGFITSELKRYILKSSDIQSYLVIRGEFYKRLRARGYPPSFLLPIFNSVSYQSRSQLLANIRPHDQPKSENLNGGPVVFKAPLTPQSWGLSLRWLLSRLKNTLVTITPAAFHWRVLVAWVMPPKFSNMWVRARLPEPRHPG
jgi:hypothetical protein